MGTTTRDVLVSAAEMADRLEAYARDIRDGTVSLTSMVENLEHDDAGNPLNVVITVSARLFRTSPQPKLRVSVDGRQLGPISGLAVKPIAGSRVTLSIDVLATYEDAVHILATAGDNARRKLAVPGGDTGG